MVCEHYLIKERDEKLTQGALVSLSKRLEPFYISCTAIFYLPLKTGPRTYDKLRKQEKGSIHALCYLHNSK